MTTTIPDTHQAQVAQLISKGWRIESESAGVTTLAKGHPTNHVLHLLLSIITVGIWIPVWILVAVLGGEKRKVVR